MSEEKENKQTFKMKLMYLCDKLFARYWWCWWSNFRFRKAIRTNIGVSEEDTVETFQQVRSLASRLYKKFKYTKDGLDQLGDAITPPPQNYQYYLDGEIKDDCDGFHSALYHCIYNSGMECYLLSVCAIGGCHCVLLYKDFGNKWRVVDYNYVLKGFDTPQEAINNYNEYFVTAYEVKSNVYANDLIEYDYTKGKFKVVSISKLK